MLYKRRCSSLAQKKARDKLYQKRLEFQKLREMVKSLTEEEKQSDAYCGIVALVNERIEKKRLENLKYRDTKMAYAKRKREMILSKQRIYEENKLREKETTSTLGEEELDKYHFDIFDRFSMFDFL